MFNNVGTGGDEELSHAADEVDGAATAGWKQLFQVRPS
jgi:hypothetical protein